MTSPHGVPPGNAPSSTEDQADIDLPFDSAITSGKSSRGLYRMSTANYLRNFSNVQGGAPAGIGTIPADPRSIHYRNALAAAQARQQQPASPSPKQTNEPSAPPSVKQLSSRFAPPAEKNASPARGVTPEKRSTRRAPTKTASTYSGTSPATTPTALSLSIAPNEPRAAWKDRGQKEKEKKEKVKSPREERKAQRAYAKAASSYVPASSPPPSAGDSSSPPPKTVASTSTAEILSPSSPPFSAIASLTVSKPLAVPASSPASVAATTSATNIAAPVKNNPSTSATAIAHPSPMLLETPVLTTAPSASFALASNTPATPTPATYTPATPAMPTPAFSSSSSAIPAASSPRAALRPPIALSSTDSMSALAAASPLATADTSAPSELASSPRSPRAAQLQWTASSPRMNTVLSTASTDSGVTIASPRQREKASTSASSNLVLSMDMKASTEKPEVNRGVAFSLPPRLQALPTAEAAPFTTLAQSSSPRAAAPTAEHNSIRKSMIRGVLRPCKIQVLDSTEVVLMKKKKTLIAYSMDIYYAADVKETMRVSYTDALEFRKKLKGVVPKSELPSLEKEKAFSISSTTKHKGRHKTDLEAFFAAVIQLESIWKEEWVRDFFDPDRHDALASKENSSTNTSAVTAPLSSSASSPLASSAISSPTPSLPPAMSGPGATPASPSADSSDSGHPLGKTKKPPSGRSLMSKLLGNSGGSAAATSPPLSGTSSASHLGDSVGSSGSTQEEKKEQKEREKEQKERDKEQKEREKEQKEKEKKEKKERKEREKEEKIASLEQQKLNSRAQMAPPKDKKDMNFKELKNQLSGNFAPSPPPTERIPIRLEVLQVVLEFLWQNCASLEGIFRVAGDRETVRKIWRSFAGSPTDLQLDSAGSGYEVAGALKLYFLQAPEPIVAPSIYEPVVKHSAAAATSSTSNSLGPSESTPTAFDLVDLRAFVQNLNPNSHAILAAVIEFLAKVTTKAEQNRMPASNLGIVFGSNLMWNPDPAAVLDPSLLSRQGVLVEHLIINYSDVFL